MPGFSPALQLCISADERNVPSLVGGYDLLKRKYLFNVISLLCITDRAVHGLDSISDNASKDPEIFISNPLTAYKFVRQLRNAGQAIEKITKMNVSKGKTSKIIKSFLTRLLIRDTAANVLERL